MSLGWKERVAGSFGKSAKTYDNYSEIQVHAAAQLVQMLPDLTHPEILEIGCGTGALTESILAKYPDGKFQITDISARMIEQAKARIGAHDRVNWGVMDGENITCNATFDLIVSAMSLQWFERPEESIKKLQQYLKPGGSMYYAAPGPLCFKEWNSVLNDLSLQSGILNFSELPGMFKEEQVVANHDNAVDFLRAIKAIGAGTPRDDYKTLSHREMKKACRLFDQQFKGNISWHILYGRLP